MKFEIKLKKGNLVTPLYLALLFSWLIFCMIFLNGLFYFVGTVYIVIMNILCEIRIRRIK